MGQSVNTSTLSMSAPYFFSLNFNLAEQSLPPADADEIVRTDPRLAWGIILFDCLIMNPDRHTGNIYHDNSTNRVQIFDHERAFMQSGRTNVTDILNDLNENLGIGGHCLAQKITDIDGQEMWLERISKIPDFFIEEVIESATRVGLPKGSKSDCIDFMKNRRSKIETLMQKQANLFPNIRRNEII
jgi:hypothetical protein